MLSRAMSRHVLDISKNGELTTSCLNLCQSSVTLTIKQSFLVFHGHRVVSPTPGTTFGDAENTPWREEYSWWPCHRGVGEIAQIGYKKGWTSQGWEVSMDVKKGREKWLVRQAAPLFFLVLCITARCLDKGMTSSKYPPVFHLLKTHSFRGQCSKGQTK